MIFLKLGGSLVTDKSRRETAQVTVIERVAQEIAEAMRAKPEIRLLVGHGSGSFGHHAAEEFGFADRIQTEEEWRSALAVRAAANRLHRIVIDLFLEGGLPAASFPPSAFAVASRGEVVDLPNEPIQRALQAGLIPVVCGDVVFDRVLGASIISTETIMTHLSGDLQPDRILLAGIEEGVYGDFPKRDRLLPEIAQADLASIRVEGAESTDVTGGMAHKVELALALADSNPEIEIRIFSGAAAGNVQAALLGYALGTRAVA